MKANVCIITFPLSEAGYAPLSNLGALLSKLASRVYIISGGEALALLKPGLNVQVINVVHNASSTSLARIINYLHTQLKITASLIPILKKTDVFVFYIGGESLVFPLLTLKLLRKKVISMPGGLTARIYSLWSDPLSKFLAICTRICYVAADKLIIHSERLVREWGLDSYREKIMISDEYFVRLDVFRIRKPLSTRKNVVGFIGRLSKEKGVINFLEALPGILEKRADLEFIIGGDGPLIDSVKECVRQKNLESKVRVLGWVPHEKLPDYLNMLRLLVIPSYTESGPLICAEAMACGTPILSTRVGIVPEIVIPNQNGFLMDSNEPDVIAENVIEITKTDMSRISVAARRTAETKFSFEANLNRWAGFLSNIETSGNQIREL